MKKRVIILSLCALSVQSFAQSKSTNTIVEKTEKSISAQREKSIDISVGYLNRELKGYTGEKINGKGFSLAVGRIIKLNDSFTNSTLNCSVSGNVVPSAYIHRSWGSG